MNPSGTSAVADCLLDNINKKNISLICNGTIYPKKI